MSLSNLLISLLMSISVVSCFWLLWIAQFSSVQLLSHVWLFGTPWITARQAYLSITSSWSLLKIMSIKSVMPSSHLILCHPLLLLPQSFPASGSFSMNQFFASSGRSAGASASGLSRWVLSATTSPEEGRRFDKWKRRRRCNEALEGHSHKPRNAGGHQKLLEAKKGFFPRASRGIMAQPTPWLVHFWPPNMWKNKFLYFKKTFYFALGIAS